MFNFKAQYVHFDEIAYVPYPAIYQFFIFNRSGRLISRRRLLKVHFNFYRISSSLLKSYFDDHFTSYTNYVCVLDENNFWLDQKRPSQVIYLAEIINDSFYNTINISKHYKDQSHHYIKTTNLNFDKIFIGSPQYKDNFSTDWLKSLYISPQELIDVRDLLNDLVNSYCLLAKLQS